MKKLALLLLAGSTLSTAHAETQLPQIVVVANRAPTEITRIASAVTVITEEEIQKKNKATVTELLREVPGLAVANNGGVGQPTSLFMRGTESRHVLVVIDGMTLNDPSDPSDRFDFSNLTTDNIERIEILRGPQSTLYGSQAIGGVINIITKRGRGAPKAEAFAEYGRYGTVRSGAGARGEVGRTSYSFSASGGRTEGISSLSTRNGGLEKDGNRTATISGNMESKLSEHFTGKLSIRYNRTDTQFDSPGTFSTIAPRPADDPLPENDNRQFNGRMAGELSLLDGVWKQEMGFSTLNVRRYSISSYYDAALFDSPFGRQVALGRRDKFDWIHRVRGGDAHAFTFGTEIWKDSFKTATLRERDVATTAYFIDDQMSLGSNAVLGASARIDNHQAFGRQFTWKAAPGYRFDATGTRLKASYGTGFKAPSLADLFSPDTGNPNLLPESSKGWDAGFEQSLWDKKISLGSTFFRNDIRNLLGNIDTFPFTSTNKGKARTQGVESVLTFHPSPSWSLRASHVYTLTEKRDNDTELKRRPRHQANLAADYAMRDDLDLGLNVRYVGSRRDGDIITFAPVIAKSFTTIELSADYSLSPSLALYGRLENLLDKRYEEVAGYGQPGRGVYAGVKAKF